eukprot:6541062-Prorocentrum_lima.AAC.1
MSRSLMPIASPAVGLVAWRPISRLMGRLRLLPPTLHLWCPRCWPRCLGTPLTHRGRHLSA